MSATDFFTSLFGIGSGAAGASSIAGALEDLKDLGSFTALGDGDIKGSYDIGKLAQQASQFQPFTIKTGSQPNATTITGEPGGGYNINYSPDEQALQNLGMTTGLSNYRNLQGDRDQVAALYDPIRNRALQGAQGMFDSVLMDPATRSQELYDLMREAQSSKELEARSALDQQLFNTGKAGMRTSMYGGSPEELAFQKALMDTKSQTLLDAMAGARAERDSNISAQRSMYDLGSAALGQPSAYEFDRLKGIGSHFGLGYTPQEKALAAMNPAINLSSIANQAKQQGAEYLTDSYMLPLSTELASQQAVANLLGSLGTGLVGGSIGSAFGDDGWLSSLGELFS